MQTGLAAKVANSKRGNRHKPSGQRVHVNDFIDINICS